MKNEKQSAFSSNNILVALLVVAAAVGGYLYNRVQTLEKGGTPNTQVAQDTTAPAAEPTTPTTMDVVKPDAKKDHWEGPLDAKVVMVEYTDFQCPYCKSFYLTPGKIMEEFKDVSHVVRDFPLSFHEKAQKAAEAVECAAEQGGNASYFKFAHAVFEAMPDVALTELGDLAAKNGLNKAKLQTCIDSDKYAQNVKDDLAEGTKAGVRATPTTVLYNMKTGKTKVIEGALPYESVKPIVQEFLKG